MSKNLILVTSLVSIAVIGGFSIFYTTPLLDPCKAVSYQTKPVIPKENTWMSALRISENQGFGFCTKLEKSTLETLPMINGAILGADGCMDGSIYCGGGRVTLCTDYDIGVSACDNEDYEISLSKDDVTKITENIGFTTKSGTSFAKVKYNDKLYQLILHTSDEGSNAAQTFMSFVEDISGPVKLERGSSVDYTVKVRNEAVFGKAPTILLDARNPARDSGLAIQMIPPKLTVGERSSLTSKLHITADENTRDGIYQIHVSGRIQDGGLVTTDDYYFPLVQVGDSQWKIYTYGQGSMRGIGGVKQSENIFAKLELDRNSYSAGQLAEIKAYLVNNSTEPFRISGSDVSLVIQVIKADSSGYYDNLYGIEARLEQGEFVVEPNSEKLIARPFYWDQGTFSSWEPSHRLEPKKYQILLAFGPYDGVVWRDEKWFEILP